MSKFRNLIESIILKETVLRCDIPPRFEDMFNDLTFHNKVNILKNPSENELKLFLNNSKKLTSMKLYHKISLKTKEILL